MKTFLLACLLLLNLPASAVTPSKSTALRPFKLDYRISLLPKTDQAKVLITLGTGGALVRELNLRFDPKRFTAIKASGDFQLSASGARWRPNGEGANLSYLVKISHARDTSSFDARMTADWAIFRGDRIVPGIKARMLKGATSRATLSFALPSGWKDVETGYARVADASFAIDAPGRRFDRPSGWIIAGQLGVRRDRFGATDVSIAAPKGDTPDRMAVLTLIHLIWPQVEAVFGKTPRKILIVSAGNPMWRGGLSSPNSFFLHADRPLVSENSTSPLVHELSHVITGIHGFDRSDWIAEGIAEFYSIEIPFRAGGMTKERQQKVYSRLQAWSRDIHTLRLPNSTGKTTARAVLLMRDLDLELRSKTAGKRSLDDLVHVLRSLHKVSTPQFINAAERLAGGPLRALDSPLLIP